MYDFAWSWTPADHIAAHSEMLRYARAGTVLQFFRWGLWLGVATVLLLMVLDVVNGDPGHIAALLPWLIVIGLWLALLFHWLPRSAARRLATHDPSLRGTIHHIVKADGFTIQTDTSTIQLSWVHFSQVVETPTFFLYFHTANTAYYTPRRAVPDAAVPGLTALLVGALGARAKLVGTSPLPVTPGP